MRSAPTWIPMIPARARRLPARCAGSPRRPACGCPGWRGPSRRRCLRGADVCCYALTANEAPIIDRISERTVVCAGFSGHGFKFAAALGPAAGDLVLGATPEIDLAAIPTPGRRPGHSPSGPCRGQAGRSRAWPERVRCARIVGVRYVVA